jgi:hypothetical protein
MKSVVEKRGQPAGISGVLLVATKLDVNRPGSKESICAEKA